MKFKPVIAGIAAGKVAYLRTSDLPVFVLEVFKNTIARGKTYSGFMGWSALVRVGPTKGQESHLETLAIEELDTKLWFEREKENAQLGTQVQDAEGSRPRFTEKVAQRPSAAPDKFPPAEAERTKREAAEKLIKTIPPVIAFYDAHGGPMKEMREALAAYNALPGV